MVGSLILVASGFSFFFYIARRNQTEKSNSTNEARETQEAVTLSNHSNETSRRAHGPWVRVNSFRDWNSLPINNNSSNTSN